jgi:hypothetical protein
VTLEGNQSRTLKQFYQESQFVLLPSNSEGWPKAIAEGMFGLYSNRKLPFPVFYMLDYGKEDFIRKWILTMTPLKNSDFDRILAGMHMTYKNEASNWSRQYTLERFETEIKSIFLHP